MEVDDGWRPANYIPLQKRRTSGRGRSAIRATARSPATCADSCARDAATPSTRTRIVTSETPTVGCVTSLQERERLVDMMVLMMMRASMAIHQLLRSKAKGDAMEGGGGRGTEAPTHRCCFDHQAPLPLTGARRSAECIETFAHRQLFAAQPSNKQQSTTTDPPLLRFPPHRSCWCQPPRRHPSRTSGWQSVELLSARLFICDPPPSPSPPRKERSAPGPLVSR